MRPSQRSGFLHKTLREPAGPPHGSGAQHGTNVDFTLENNMLINNVSGMQWHRFSWRHVRRRINWNYTIGEATRGSTLSEELRLKLGFELNRGKRHFLITGSLPSPASTCNTRGTELTVGHRTHTICTFRDH